MKLKVTPPALVYAVTVLPRGIFKNSHYAVLIQTRIDFIPMCHPRDVGSQKLISSLTQNFNMSIQNEIDESKVDCWKLSYGVLWPEIVSCFFLQTKSRIFDSMRSKLQVRCVNMSNKLKISKSWFILCVIFIRQQILCIRSIKHFYTIDTVIITSSHLNCNPFYPSAHHIKLYDISMLNNFCWFKCFNFSLKVIFLSAVSSRIAFAK